MPNTPAERHDCRPGAAGWDLGVLWSLGSLPELLFADCQSGMRAAGRMSPRAVEAARVRKVWSEVRAVFGNAYDFVDFVNHDDEVARRTNKTALAIELAVQKEVG